MYDCEVEQNCNGFTQESCWYCENYSMYTPKDPKILCKRQVETRLQRKEEKKLHKETKEYKQGKKALKTGENGEREIVKILNKYNIKAERVKGSGRFHSSATSCDIKLNVFGSEKRAEVKRRKKGFETIYKFLSQDERSNMVFMKADRKPWLVCMSIEDFINMFGDSYSEHGEE